MADGEARGTFLSRITADPALPPRSRSADLIRRHLLDGLSPEERDALAGPLADDRAAQLVAGLLAHSPFLAQIMRRDPAWLAGMLSSEPEALVAGDQAAAIAEAAKATSLDEIMPLLRRFRNKAALLIALCDCGGVWTVDEVVAAISRTADICVQAAVDFILRRAAERGSFQPVDAADIGAGSGLVILAMGKHGAGELNYSSDIDLVVFYDPELAAARGVSEPPSFFVRLARDMARILQERTPDGYCFRVDLRLRPDPASTQPAVSLDSAFAYYESVGQNWERAAFIKARPVAGDLARGRRFLADLAPFIWRKYFDFATIADIHAMKRQIQAVKGHEVIAVAGHDVKLGRGGIREVEFFVQTQQLVFGGRRPALRGGRTLDMLAALHTEGWITPAARDELAAAYRFLRGVEHRIQMRHDEQTQRLPADAEDLAAFARFCGYRTPAAFEKEFRAHAGRVESHYALLFEEGPSLAAEAGTLSFTGAEIDPGTVETLGRLGFRSPETVAETVRGWHFGRRPAVTSARAREALTELTPALLVAFGRSGDPDAALNALDAAFARMPAAVELLSLLRSREALLSLFAAILGGAPRLARTVAHHPHVLDGVIDPAFAAPSVDPALLASRIRAFVGDPPSFEDALDRMRDAARAENFLVGARLMTGVYGAEQAGRAWSAVADAMVAEALAASERDMARAHGLVPGASVALFALGRLGTRDLTATSDLDLVILYDAPDMEARSDGGRPLDAVTWHQRFAQRLIAALTSPTRRGSLYEVDLRLRPQGGKGPLAVRLSSFEEYQAGEADLWEHMALTKARPCGGDRQLADRAQAVIGSVLSRKRDPAVVRRGVREMRRLIAEAKGDGGPWDLKLAPGGLTDVDFVAEGLVLAHAAEAPEMIGAGFDAVFAFAAARGWLPPADAEALREGARLMNRIIHWRRLALDEMADARETPPAVLRLLCRASGMPDASTLESALADARAAVRAAYSRWVS